MSKTNNVLHLLARVEALGKAKENLIAELDAEQEKVANLETMERLRAVEVKALFKDIRDLVQVENNLRDATRVLRRRGRKILGSGGGR